MEREEAQDWTSARLEQSTTAALCASETQAASGYLHLPIAPVPAGCDNTCLNKGKDQLLSRTGIASSPATFNTPYPSWGFFYLLFFFLKK